MYAHSNARNQNINQLSQQDSSTTDDNANVEHGNWTGNMYTGYHV